MTDNLNNNQNNDNLDPLSPATFKWGAWALLITIVAIGLFLLIGNSNFDIVGKWKNVGADTFGQAQAGSIIIFDGANCNLYSPYDTYAFYKDGEDYYLDVTGALFSDNRSFRVRVIDKNNIEIYNSFVRLIMKRVG